MATLKLWSKRWNASAGLHWRLERECTEETAKQWLAIFQKDELDTIFVVSEHKPFLRKTPVFHWQEVTQ